MVESRDWNAAALLGCDVSLQKESSPLLFTLSLRRREVHLQWLGLALTVTCAV